MLTTNDKGVFKFSVNGKTITNSSASHGVGGKWFDSDGTYEGVEFWNDSNTFEDITTDGEGVWVTANRNGDAYRSTDNGVTWSIIVDGISGNNWKGITAPVIFPL
jgi:hypothetical protein